MIKVSRLNGKEFFVNHNLIETMEETPDTVITLTTEKKLIVQEKISDIINNIIKHNKKIFLEHNRIK